MRIEAGLVSLSPNDLVGAWRGAVEWTEAEGWWQPWRISPRELETTLSAVLTDRARIGNGVRLHVLTDANAVDLETVGDDECDGVLDVIVNGELLVRRVVPNATCAFRVDLPPGNNEVEVWLPHAARIKIRPVQFHGASTIAPAERSGQHWVAYGSSITQGNAAGGPTRTWPARVSRMLGIDVTALGMAGQCHLDHAVAHTISGLNADVISLCLGINIYGGATFNERSLPSALSGFFHTIRNRHPYTPLLVITPIASPDREEEANSVGLTLAHIRQLVERSARIMIDHGDEHMHLISGLDIISPSDSHLLHDGLHPDDAGYKLMAERLAPRFSAILKEYAGRIVRA